MSPARTANPARRFSLALVLRPGGRGGKSVHVRSEQVNLALVEELAVLRHEAFAPFGDGLDDEGLGTAVQPDLVGEVGRADLLIALAIGAVARRANRLEFSFAAIRAQAVVGTPGELQHVM